MLQQYLSVLRFDIAIAMSGHLPRIPVGEDPREFQYVKKSDTDNIPFITFKVYTKLCYVVWDFVVTKWWNLSKRVDGSPNLSEYQYSLITQLKS